MSQPLMVQITRDEWINACEVRSMRREILPAGEVYFYVRTRDRTVETKVSPEVGHRILAAMARQPQIVLHAQRYGLQPALSAVSVERERQVLKGYDPAHDDAHARGELRLVAGRLCFGQQDPWGILHKYGGDHRRQCVIAAALLVAEIERLDRVAAGQAGVA